MSVHTYKAIGAAFAILIWSFMFFMEDTNSGKFQAFLYSLFAVVAALLLMQ